LVIGGKMPIYTATIDLLDNDIKIFTDAQTKNEAERKFKSMKKSYGLGSAKMEIERMDKLENLD
jgi:hypothetical protein